MELETKNSQRNSGSKKESIDEEVQKLLRKSSIKISEYDFNKLREKYGNEELVVAITLFEYLIAHISPLSIPLPLVMILLLLTFIAIFI